MYNPRGGRECHIRDAAMLFMQTNWS